MTWRHVTEILLLVVFGGLGVYDLACYFAAGSHATISRVILHYAETYPLIPFGMGVLVGHLLCAQHVRG